jgi:hypothetical protein
MIIVEKDRKISKRAIELAAENGNLEIVVYLVEHSEKMQE